MSRRGVLLLSGGVDSAYLAGIYSRVFSTCVFVDYGQPAANAERASARAIASEFSLSLQEIVVRGAMLGDLERREDARVVPGRNFWLVAFAFGFAKKGGDVWLGAAPQDRADYADCRPDVLRAYSHACELAELGRVRWSAATRKKRLRFINERGLEGLVYSCYEPEPCGVCPSCLQDIAE